MVSAKKNAFFTETVRWTDRLASMTALRLVIWVLVIAYTHAGIVSDPLNLAAWMDDHQFYAWEDSDRTTLLHYGQLPAWNPFWCGGMVGIPAPEDPFLSPDFILRLVFGVATGRQLTVLLLVVLGLEGMYRLCRKLDASAVGAAFAAVVFANCDRFVVFVRDGWVHFFGFELIPWVILALIAGVTSWRWRIVGGFFFSWIVLAPGTYPTPFTLIAMGYVTIALSLLALLRNDDVASGPGRRWHERPYAAIWVSGATMGVVSLGLSFGKLVPTLVWVRQFARTFVVTEVHDAAKVFTDMWPHYGVVVTIALIGVATADRAAAIFCGGGLLSFALACGDFGPYAPFHLLKALPIVGQLRYPDRYMVLFVFFVAVAAARGITRLEDGLPALLARAWEAVHPFMRRGPAVLPRAAGQIAVGASALLAVYVAQPLATTIVEPMRIAPHSIYVEPPPRAYDQPFRQHRGNRRDGHIFPPMNMGSLYCASGNPLPESPLLRADLAQEEYPVDPTKATVTRKSWSPHVIELDVDAKEATTIYVNQNWAPQWRTNIGTVKSVEKLLAVDVPAGKHLVRLKYTDWFLIACLLVSAATLIGILYVFGRDGVRWCRAEWAGFDKLPWWPAPDDTSIEPKPVTDHESAPSEDAHHEDGGTPSVDSGNEGGEEQSPSEAEPAAENGERASKPDPEF